MKYLMFLITIIFSSNVLSATYLICKNMANKTDIISVKVDRNKIYINESNTELINYTEFIETINKEVIYVKKNYPEYPKMLDCDKYKMRDLLTGLYRFNCYDNETSKKNDILNNAFAEYSLVASSLPNSYLSYKFDRISGQMNRIDSYYFLNWDFGKGRVIQDNRFSHKYFQCEVKEKTLF